MEQSEIAGWAAFLRPFMFLLVMVAIVYPLTVVFRRYFPAGRFKSFLLRERTRPEANWRDKALYTACVIGSMVVFFAVVALTIGVR